MKQIFPLESFSTTAFPSKMAAMTSQKNTYDCKIDHFSVGFRTTPMDNTGVSHILEHTTLCGSAKFPCRDPFFSMLTRSLSTYMNAWTGW